MKIYGPPFYSGLRLHPDYDIGCLAQSMGRYRSAIAKYKKAIRLTNYYKAHYNLGVIWLERHRYSDAIREFKAAVKGDPNLSLAHTNLGVVYDELGQHKKANREYLEAIRLDPKDPMPLANLGHTFAVMGQYRKAIPLLRRALRIEPRYPYALRILGYVLIEEGLSLSEGIQMLQKAKRKDPKNAQILADLAVGYLKQGKKKRAEILARQSRDIAPRDGVVLKQTRRVLAKRARSRNPAPREGARAWRATRRRGAR